jgi:hypothetical protein
MPTRRRESRCGSNHYTTTKTHRLPSILQFIPVFALVFPPPQTSTARLTPSEYWCRVAPLISLTAFSASSECHSTFDLISAPCALDEPKNLLPQSQLFRTALSVDHSLLNAQLSRLGLAHACLIIGSPWASDSAGSWWRTAAVRPQCARLPFSAPRFAFLREWSAMRPCALANIVDSRSARNLARFHSCS